METTTCPYCQHTINLAVMTECELLDCPMCGGRLEIPDGPKLQGSFDPMEGGIPPSPWEDINRRLSLEKVIRRGGRNPGLYNRILKSVGLPVLEEKPEPWIPFARPPADVSYGQRYATK